MWQYVLGLLLIVCLVGIFLPTSMWAMILPAKAITTQGPLALETSPQVLDTAGSQTMLISSNAGSFQAFVYPLPFQRTGQAVVCSTSGTPGQPDCSSGKYGICPCSGTDCSPCKHTGYVNILNISNLVRIELLAAPDASRQNASATQLVVRGTRANTAYVAGNTTNISPTETVEETISLPNLPIQRWTMITVAREGRRFDVYYNNKLVLSKRAQYILDTSSAVGPIIAGDSLLNGKIALIQVYPIKLTAVDVSVNYSNLTNTNGEPSLSTDTSILNGVNFCPGGSCFQGPAVKPASPLLEWDSNYQ